MQQDIGQSSVQESLFTNNKGQSVIQDNQAVETHNLQGSEGQLRKPTKLFGVDVIATPIRKDNEVNARSDDLLALQVLGNQLEHNLSGKDEVVSSLNLDPEILVSESRTFTNRLLVRCETPTSCFQERRREMAEIEHFLDNDFRFSGFAGQFKGFSSGSSRDQWLEGFLKGIWRWHHEGDDLFQERGWQVCRFIACMMKSCRMYQVCLKRRNGAEEPRAQATSLLVAALHLVPWFHIP
jgi:hypothetical protein